MQTYLLAAETGEGTGNPVLNIAIFGLFIAITLYIVARAGKTTNESAVSTPEERRLAARKTALPSPVTTSPPHRSWASWAQSR